MLGFATEDDFQSYLGPVAFQHPSYFTADNRWVTITHFDTKLLLITFRRLQQVRKRSCHAREQYSKTNNDDIEVPVG